MVLPIPTKTTARKTRRCRLFALASISMKCARIDAEQLRTQIDQLHAEAETNWSKANSARLRLMRLSEAAEKLQHRAATVIALGKENEARELLIQKRKIMQALEKTKSRLEVLDELLVKIKEAISLNENQLISNVMSIPEIFGEESSQEIRIISPTIEVCTDKVTTDVSMPKKEEGFIATGRLETIPQLDHEQGNSESVANESEDINSMISNLWAVSSYEDFLEHIDGQLRLVELDLCNFLRLSGIILDSKQQQTNSRVLHVSEILDSVVSTRGSLKEKLYWRRCNAVERIGRQVSL
ncbi:hypothetical protein HPP92_024264 [Vanilla planifolia]|uniref:Uncharacterized protein n=1 Tax=Vanilla planifolia TaxID=51239 RepID=A0A835UEI4_VANPL|nr:hypothetical protein HPP92_024591 [Vanilla planifolia]KAG0456476.1 hypothetical protein HPP92_024264 [Vanilla planifolia]